MHHLYLLAEQSLHELFTADYLKICSKRECQWMLLYSMFQYVQQHLLNVFSSKLVIFETHCTKNICVCICNRSFLGLNLYQQGIDRLFLIFPLIRKTIESYFRSPKHDLFIFNPEKVDVQQTRDERGRT